MSLAKQYEVCGLWGDVGEGAILTDSSQTGHADSCAVLCCVMRRSSPPRSALTSVASLLLTSHHITYDIR